MTGLVVDDGEAEEMWLLGQYCLLPSGIALQAEVPVLVQVNEGIGQLLVRGEGAEEDLNLVLDRFQFLEALHYSFRNSYEVAIELIPY